MSSEAEWDSSDTEEVPEDEADAPTRYEIMNYPADTTLQGYVDMWDRNELKLPEFQRGLVWSQVRASKLIESFLLGLPVPGVFLYKQREKSTYQILDGHQRIKSIIAFIKGVFKEQVFRLKNVSSEWNNKKFEDLSEQEQFSLKVTVLRATIIQQIDPNDDTSVYQIFERLNTGGMNLNTMEIRQCLAYGKFIDHLKELNCDESWRKIIGKPLPDQRLRDVELILRCLALQKNGENYEKPMKRFLNQFAENERNNPSNYESEKSNFANICSSIVAQLGEKPFHYNGKLNYGFLDAVVSSLLLNDTNEKLKNIRDELISDEEFKDAITRNTSDVVQVKKRLQIAKRVLSH